MLVGKISIDVSVLTSLLVGVSIEPEEIFEYNAETERDEPTQVPVLWATFTNGIRLRSEDDLRFTITLDPDKSYFQWLNNWLVANRVRYKRV